MRKEKEASSPVSFTEQSKWYKKYWKTDLAEWLENFHCLPVNANCARQWLKDKQHLNNCNCLVSEAKEIYLLFTNLLKRIETQLKDCKCSASKKTRVSNDYYAWCEICEKTISVASKKRVIKNHNDPKFWGIFTPQKVLCLACLKFFYSEMPMSKKYIFNKYLRRGYN